MMDPHRVHTFFPPRPRLGLRLLVVGTGGTGGWLVDGVAGLLLDLAECRDAGVRFHDNALAPYPVELALIDPDIVEHRNLARQNFWRADEGQPKARVLARRYREALGLESEFHCTLFRPDNPMQLPGTDVELLIGCGDNTAVRRALHAALGGAATRDSRGGTWHAPRRMLLDLGNGRHDGQVLFGTAAEQAGLAGAFHPLGACTALPAPGLFRPSLLDPVHDAAAAPGPARQDCAARILSREQSLTINRHVATHALTLLERLFLGELTYFGVFLSNADGATAQHIPLTPHAVASAFGSTPEALGLYYVPPNRAAAVTRAGANP